MRRSWSIGVALAAVLVTLVAGPGRAAADPHGDQDKINQQLAETQSDLEVDSARVQQAAAAYQAATAQLPIAQQNLADARGVLAGAQAHAVSTAREAQTAQAALGVANQSLAQAAQQVEQARAVIAQYAVSAYEGGDVAGLSALLSVAGPADFVAGLTYLGHVAQVQQADLDANSRARVAEKNRQNLQAARERAAAAADRDAAAAVTRAQAAQDSAERARQAVTALIAQQGAALQVAESEKADTLARYDQLQAESDRIAAEIRAQAATGGDQVLRPGARLPMPVVGWKSSDFGMRFDPYYHVWQLHAGVDLAAAAGTPIWAVAPGRVIQAGWDGGYGNYTCIYHGLYQGQAFATCYAHQSQILVHVGEQVVQGQVIGRVGMTGAATGDHLHFEVRLNGVPVDPVPWLPACLC